MAKDRNWLSCFFVVAMLLTSTDLLARETHSTLTQKTYQQRCLLCHMSAAPEGVSEKILVGLRATPGRKPEDVMPGVECWRRCEQCWPQSSNTKKSK